jgi:hypothetical protein
MPYVTLLCHPQNFSTTTYLGNTEQYIIQLFGAREKKFLGFKRMEIDQPIGNVLNQLEALGFKVMNVSRCNDGCLYTLHKEEIQTQKN